MLTAPATACGPARAGGAARGFWNAWSSGTNGCGSSANDTSNTTVAAATTRAHQRQPRPMGSDPVGVSNATKPAQAGTRATPLM
jgi:hypothetical protein